MSLAVSASRTCDGRSVERYQTDKLKKEDVK